MRYRTTARSETLIASCTFPMHSGSALWQCHCCDQVLTKFQHKKHLHTRCWMVGRSKQRLCLLGLPHATAKVSASSHMHLMMNSTKMCKSMFCLSCILIYDILRHVIQVLILSNPRSCMPSISTFADISRCVSASNAASSSAVGRPAGSADESAVHVPATSDESGVT